MPSATMKNIQKKTAKELVAAYGVAVDLERLLKDEGITLKREPMEESVSGMLVVKPAETIVVVNSLHHHTRQRFTIAHECGHYFLHADGASAFIDQSEKVFRRDAVSACGTHTQEVQANWFAAELLMPKEYLEKKFDVQKIDLYDDYQLRLIASELKVSVQALTVRLTALGFIPNDGFGSQP